MCLHLKGGINFGGILQRKETVTNLSYNFYNKDRETISFADKIMKVVQQQNSNYTNQETAKLKQQK